MSRMEGKEAQYLTATQADVKKLEQLLYQVQAQNAIWHCGKSATVFERIEFEGEEIDAPVTLTVDGLRYEARGDGIELRA